MNSILSERMDDDISRFYFLRPPRGSRSSVTESGINHQAYHHKAQESGGLAVASWLAARGDKKRALAKGWGKVRLIATAHLISRFCCRDSFCLFKYPLCKKH
jgi:hypothetical protein